MTATKDQVFIQDLLSRAGITVTGEWASTKVIGPDVTIKFSVRLRKVG